jgi:hypothetical protein
VIVLGNPFVGIVHPCKIYNILRIASPFLAISPRDCHITDLLSEDDVQEYGAAFRHGDAGLVAEFLEEHAAAAEWRSARQSIRSAMRYSKEVLLPRMIDAIVPTEAAPASEESMPEARETVPPRATSGSRLAWTGPRRRNEPGEGAGTSDD